MTRSTTWLFPCGLTAALLLTSGSAAALPTDHEASILLKHLANRIENVDRLMWVKRESPPINQLARSIAEEADAIDRDVSAYARAQDFELRAEILPGAEVAARDLYQETARSRLLDLSGAAFEYEFLINQRIAVGQLYYLSRVMADHVAGDQRPRWQQRVERLARLQAQIDELLVS